MAKWKNISFWTLGIVVLATVFAFSENKRKELRIKNVAINIDYSDNNYFVSKDDIRNMVLDGYPYIDSLFLQEINIPLLEESIDNHPSIRKTEVYSKLDGSLQIDVYQKLPIARIQNSGTAFYIDELGDTMPLSPGYAARVPLINGHINGDNLTKVYSFLRDINKDEFFRDFFSGISIGNDEEWILYPKPGNHHVLIGKPDELDKKMKKLKIFYQNVADKKNINGFKTINLKYEGQVICRKY